MREVEPIWRDDILLGEIKNGNQTAFNILFEKYWETIYSKAYKRLKNADDAKDIVQEIFTHLWIKRESLSIQNLPAYLHVSVRNQVFKIVSKKSNYSFFSLLDNVVEKGFRTDTNLLWKEFFHSYQALLKTLPPRRQEIFRLRFDEDLSTKEIASRLDISQKTVQNQLGKAIETLKVTLLRILIVALLVS